MNSLIFKNQHEEEALNINNNILSPINENYIIINSIDRDWYNNTIENPYKFKVVFGNNNLYGVNNANQHILLNYKPSNINKISCQKIILPAKLMYDKFKPNNLDYIILNIDNIDKITNSSNAKLQNALAVLRPSHEIVSNSNYRFLEFININNQYKNINNLTYMDIELLRGDGTLINFDNYFNDVLSIEQIVYDSSSKMLKMKTTNYFYNNFTEGDIIKIKNYLFRQTNLSYNEIALFNSYINRDEGHIIQSVEKSNESNEFYDIINILPVGDTSTGSFNLIDWFNLLVIKTDIDSDLENDNSGKLINYNLQTTIFMKIN